MGSGPEICIFCGQLFLIFVSQLSIKCRHLKLNCPSHATLWYPTQVSTSNDGSSSSLTPSLQVYIKRPPTRTTRALTIIPATCVVPLLVDEAEPTKVIGGEVDGMMIYAFMSITRHSIKCWKRTYRINYVGNTVF